MAVQNLVLVSEDVRPLDGLVEVLKGANPDMSVFRADCLEEFLEVTRHLKAEVLVADLSISDIPGAEPDDSMFAPAPGDARKDMSYLKSYIRRHYSEDLSLRKLSQIASVTGNYLCAVFKEKEGESIGAYITRIRMEKAALLLVIRPDVQVKDIAHSVGYRNLSYFDRVFRNRYGLPPREYREKYTDPAGAPFCGGQR